jgi:hypothetical protein
MTNKYSQCLPDLGLTHREGAKDAKRRSKMKIKIGKRIKSKSMSKIRTQSSRLGGRGDTLGQHANV